MCFTELFNFNSQPSQEVDIVSNICHMRKRQEGIWTVVLLTSKLMLIPWQPEVVFVIGNGNPRGFLFSLSPFIKFLTIHGSCSQSYWMNSEHSHTNCPQFPPSPRFVSAMKIQALSTWLEITEKTNCRISNTLKGSTYKYSYIYRSHCPNDEVPVGPGFPRGSQCIPTDLSAGLGVQQCALASLFLLGTRGMPEIEELAKHWLHVFRRDTGYGIWEFHICTKNPLPCPSSCNRLALKALKIP